MIPFFLFSLVECKNSDIEKNEAALENTIQYVKDDSVYAYINEDDIGKKTEDVKDKKYLEFGSKLTVLKAKNLGGKCYYKIQLPNKIEYWVQKDSLAKKFIVINQADVIAYKKSDRHFFTPIRLQPGDFGVFIKKEIGDRYDTVNTNVVWINVDLYAYRPHKTNGKKKYIGNKWIKNGYTEDIKTAKEAYYLSRAYYWDIQKKNKEKAIEMLNKALEVNAGVETENTYVVKAYLNTIK